MTLTPGTRYDKTYKLSFAKVFVRPDTNQANNDIKDLAGKLKRANDGYEQFVAQLPIYAGTFILMGINKQNKEIPISFQNYTNSRAEFKANVVINRETNETITRLEWLNLKIAQHNFKEIVIYSAKKNKRSAHNP